MRVVQYQSYAGGPGKLTPDEREKSIALQCFLWPTAGQSARMSLDPKARAPLKIEFYFHLHTYEIEQCVLREI